MEVFHAFEGGKKMKGGREGVKMRYDAKGGLKSGRVAMGPGGKCR